MRLTISIVEDDRVTREYLRKVIETNPSYQCVGEYGSAEEALEKLPGNLPDVVLMDIQMPGRSGIECALALKTAHPDLLVLMLTTYDNSELIFNALRAGANGYLLKRSKPEEILNAIENVYAGGAPMSASVARMVVTHFHQNKQPAREVDKLSSREREILELLAKGLLYKEVADQLGISRSTVNTHIEAIYRKLHVQSRTEAIMKLPRF
jgi:DNA-binding NarL/FixJ family response regulator